MAGKHCKARQRKARAQRRWAPSLAAAAVTATSLMTALSTGTTVTVSPAVELTALITPANSTAQIFASSDYYNRDWVGMYGQPQVVPFFLGPQGIVRAIDRNATDPLGTAVLASGWGAGQTGTALAIIAADPASHPGKNNIKLVVLDNNTNRAGGGFWTTYYPFAPLLFTSAAPTPSDTGIPVLDVAYEYNINSNAATYPINLFSDVNSLVAYVFDYGGQADAPVPQYIIDEAQNPNAPVHYHYILNEDGTQAEPPIPLDGSTTTYVTFKSKHLPLVKPLLLIPGGEIVADLVEPILTVLVNAGYKDNQPIPQDPRVPRPMGLFPSASETTEALDALPGAVKAGVNSLQGNLSSTNIVTNTLEQNTGSRTVNAVAGNSPKPTTPISPFDLASTVVPGKKKPTSSSSTGTKNPLRQAVGDFTSGLSDLADSLRIGAKKPSNPATPSDSSAGSTTPST